MTEGLDRARTARLIRKIYRLIKAHYIKGQPSQAKVLEALQALAAVAAIIMKGTGPDPRVTEFFEKALLQGMQEANAFVNEIDKTKH